MSVVYLCDDCCNEFKPDELAPCAEVALHDHCEECLPDCRPCAIDRTEDRSAQVALDIVRGK